MEVITHPGVWTVMFVVVVVVVACSLRAAMRRHIPLL